MNCHEYGSLDRAIERVVQIDSDDELYEQYLSEPYFHGDQINPYADKDRILGQFNHIFSNPIRRFATTMAFKWRGLRWNALRGIARFKSMLQPRGPS